ncbi:hypothetical protein BDK92_7281 [Micromonospora pisi]|uniref:Uncharacterized protein n=1 Tax=Micromonospora pisi TaxID=589240 RepID=A0A495JX81_9ACTN|nr:hypothetical protein [Micromonospora pisi]RKR92799.1 hypothetical protein BDK92_7281 [Micromonospora pisi]
MTTLADGLLHLLKTEPTLLPPAPKAGNLAAAIEYRRYGEVHDCLRCPEPAGVAYIAHTKIGNRWLDLCWACNHWLQSNLTPPDDWGPTT